MAARIARAQKRFAQASGPLPTVPAVPATPPLPTTTPSAEEQAPD